MTFEEFLIKKKIDPVQLKNTEQALFFEFQSHFNEMGEKSFDHSKKFWFNKLRRANPLKEEPKPEITPLLAPISTADSVVNPPILKEDQIKIGLIGDEITNPKPAFKPRFKANILTPPQQQLTDSVSSIPAEVLDPEKPKPAYKPRFKAAIPVAEEPKVENNVENKNEDISKQIIQPKPAFKPRFKPAMIRKDPEQE